MHSFNDVGKAWITVFNVITNDDWYYKGGVIYISISLIGMAF